LPEVAAAAKFVTLSPLCPADAAQAARLTGLGAAYELLCRRGWICSPEGSHLRRKSVWMITEGSVLTGSVQSVAGRLVDVKPDMLQAHPVYRYGYAFAVGVND
jgi:hypothetical protein